MPTIKTQLDNIIEQVEFVKSKEVIHTANMNRHGELLEKTKKLVEKEKDLLSLQKNFDLAAETKAKRKEEV